MTITNKIRERIAFARREPRMGFLILAEIIAGLAASLASLAIFIAIADEVIEKETMGFDLGVSQLIYYFREPWLTQAMGAVTFLGSKEFLIAAALIIILVLWQKHRREAALFGITLLASTALSGLIKLSIHRSRPDLAPLGNYDFYSFPSGHAMNSFVFYSLLAYFAYHFTRSKRGAAISWIAAILLAGTIGLSRIYLGAHYPTDVIAGFIAGFWVFATAIAIEKTLRLNKFFKESKNL